MLAQRCQKNRASIRRTQLQKMLQRDRDRHELVEQLEAWLCYYDQCILTSGETQQRGHSSRMECQEFTTDLNKDVQSLLVSIGTDHLVNLLRHYRFPERLRGIYEVVSDQSEQFSVGFSKRNHKSRMKVLDSIVEILCIMTEKSQLFELYGIDVGARQIAEKFASLSKDPKSHSDLVNNVCVGLYNLLCHEQTEEEGYKALEEINFTGLFERWIVSGQLSLFTTDTGLDLVMLLRKYLEVGHQSCIDNMTQLSLMQIHEFITTSALFSGSSKTYGQSAVDLSDEGLRICLLLFPHSQSLDFILHTTDLYNHLNFVKLLEQWSYKHPQLTINCFSDDELELLLRQMNYNSIRATATDFIETLIMALTNLILNEDSKSQIGSERLCKAIKLVQVEHFFEDYQVKNPQRQSLLDLIEDNDVDQRPL